MTEKEMVEKLFSLSGKLDEIALEEKKTKDEYERLENELHEYMCLNNLKNTGEYAGLGKITDGITTYATYTKENEERFFDWLRKNGLGDIIKPTVHWKTLSSLISDNIEEGRAIPEFINIFQKPKMKLIKPRS